MTKRKPLRVKKNNPKGGTSAENPYRIFVSHATADKWVARMICEKLDQLGAKTFRDDRDISGGDDIPDKIRLEIKRSDELLVLWTPKSKDRHWVILEIGMALGRRKEFPIVVVLYHEGAESIPAMLKSKKAIELNEFDNYLKDVAARLGKGKR